MLIQLNSTSVQQSIANYLWTRHGLLLHINQSSISITPRDIKHTNPSCFVGIIQRLNETRRSHNSNMFPNLSMYVSSKWAHNFAKAYTTHGTVHESLHLEMEFSCAQCKYFTHSTWDIMNNYWWQSLRRQSHKTEPLLSFTVQQNLVSRMIRPLTWTSSITDVFCDNHTSIQETPFS